MFDVTVHASTSNLGSGFDAVGMALSLANTYRFEVADTFRLSGFEKRFQIDQNLVLNAYLKTFQMFKKDLLAVPVMISQQRQEIPVSRGLGSSSACIVAGVCGALLMAGEALDKEKIMTYATAIEGHPDNVAAVIYGGLVTVMKTADGWLVRNHPVHPGLNMMLLIPDLEIKTKEARSRLPKTYPILDVTHAIARALVLPYAFGSGDLTLIGHVFDDLIHEPYRYPLIPRSKDVKDLIRTHGGRVAISGSGPTLFVVSDSLIDLKSTDFEAYGSWQVCQTEVLSSGVLIKTLEKK